MLTFFILQDSHTEKEIQDSLRRVSQGKTTLVIAHRLSTIIDAVSSFVILLHRFLFLCRGKKKKKKKKNKILVIKDKKVAERGTHDQVS